MKSISFYAFALLAGLIIFLGLPLVGWGIGQLPKFFDSPARLTYALIILFLQIFGLVYNPQAGRSKGEEKSGVKKSRVDLVLIQIFSLAIVFLAPFSDGHSIGVFPFNETLRFLGFLLLIPGFILMQLAEKYLDRQFSIEVTVQKNHKLIQHGPYTYIRHPRYLGILAFFGGISIVFRSYLALFLVVALAIVLIWRVYAEEALMQREFGTEWEAYRKKSWRIVPFVF
ncbi:MAG: isoprenylcysteine carboxylmethyltransferase family protein [Anaerolineales bacterium]|nr:isoprenylcysteine carboxylmethyltransferase family protein [Anaerolineales bacterium]